MRRTGLSQFLSVLTFYGLYVTCELLKNTLKASMSTYFNKTQMVLHLWEKYEFPGEQIPFLSLQKHWWKLFLQTNVLRVVPQSSATPISTSPGTSVGSSCCIWGDTGCSLQPSQMAWDMQERKKWSWHCRFYHLPKIGAHGEQFKVVDSTGQTMKTVKIQRRVRW